MPSGRSGTRPAGGATRVYGWSFDSQGTGDDRQASEDHFLAAAIQWFGVEIAESANPADKGQALAERLCAERCLLILDGCEPLQYPPGPLAGELRAPGLKTMLTQFAAAGQPGLCILTSRERLQDLSEWVRGDTHPGPGSAPGPRETSATPTAPRLLHARGAKCAGETAIGPADPELLAASREVQRSCPDAEPTVVLPCPRQGRRHPLPHEVGLIAGADRDARGHAARVIAPTADLVRPRGRPSVPAGSGRPRCDCSGYFDRPAARAELAWRRCAPPRPSPGLTEALAGPRRRRLDPGPQEPRRLRPGPGRPGETRSRSARSRSGRSGPPDPTPPDPTDPNATRPAPRGGALDAHPLVREHLAAALAARSPDAWREGHRRLYERLKGSVPHRPDGLDGLQPLYQAVAHGCQAGPAGGVYEVYEDRILRGTGQEGPTAPRNSARSVPTWGPSPVSSRALVPPGLRLKRSRPSLAAERSRLQPARLGPADRGPRADAGWAGDAVKQEDWKNAAIRDSNLSELELTLGEVAGAVRDAEQSGTTPTAAAMRFRRMSHAHDPRRRPAPGGPPGRGGGALPRGRADAGRAPARIPAAVFRAGLPVLRPALGRRRACRGWRRLTRKAQSREAENLCVAAPSARSEACHAVAERAAQTFEWPCPTTRSSTSPSTTSPWAAPRSTPILLSGRPPAGRQKDQRDSRPARRRHHEFLVRGLLTRAWLRHTQGDGAGAAADLAEVERIATRGGMRLHLADCLSLPRPTLPRPRRARAGPPPDRGLRLRPPTAGAGRRGDRRPELVIPEGISRGRADEGDRTFIGLRYPACRASSSRPTRQTARRNDHRCPRSRNLAAKMPDVPLSRERPLDRHVLVERVPLDASEAQLAGCAFLRGRGEQGLLLSGLLLLAGT